LPNGFDFPIWFGSPEAIEGRERKQRRDVWKEEGGKKKKEDGGRDLPSQLSNAGMKFLHKKRKNWEGKGGLGEKGGEKKKKGGEQRGNQRRTDRSPLQRAAVVSVDGEGKPARKKKRGEGKKKKVATSGRGYPTLAYMWYSWMRLGHGKEEKKE